MAGLARILCKSALGCECDGLCNPIVALNAALELEAAVDPSDFTSAPFGDLIEMPEPHIV